MFVVLILIFAIACLSFEKKFIYDVEHQYRSKALIHKGITTLCIILIAIVSLCRTGNNFVGRFVLLGLLFGLGGDLLLEARFIYPEKFKAYFLAGTASFFVGHVFYVIALYSLAPKAWIVAIPVVVASVICEFTIQKREALDMGNLFAPMGVYYLMLSFMAGSAIGAMILHIGVGTVLFAVAGVLFVLSDIILGIQCFSDHPTILKHRRLHKFYWIAQLLIALCPLFIK